MNQKTNWKDALKAAEMKRRILMTFFGILLCSMGVALFKTADFGTDPFQVLVAGLDNVIPLGFGTVYLIVNLVLLVAMFVVDRHYIGLGTALNLLLMGYVVEFFMWVITLVVPDPTFWARVIMLVIGIPLLCAASSLYFTADLGVSTYDVWALTLDKRTKIPFRALRITTDLICTLIGFLLHATVGVGTLITAFFMGPLIDVFNRKLAQPLRYGTKKGQDSAKDGVDIP